MISNIFFWVFLDEQQYFLLVILLIIFLIKVKLILQIFLIHKIFLQYFLLSSHYIHNAVHQIIMQELFLIILLLFFLIISNLFYFPQLLYKPFMMQKFQFVSSNFIWLKMIICQLQNILIQFPLILYSRFEQQFQIFIVQPYPKFAILIFYRQFQQFQFYNRYQSWSYVYYQIYYLQNQEVYSFCQQHNFQQLVIQQGYQILGENKYFYFQAQLLSKYFKFLQYLLFKNMKNIYRKTKVAKQIQKKILFTLKLKIANQIVDIDVFDDDNNQSLVNRVCENHNMKNEYKKILEQKILEALFFVLKKQKINSNLKIKVAEFIQKNCKNNMNKAIEKVPILQKIIQKKQAEQLEDKNNSIQIKSKSSKRLTSPSVRYTQNNKKKSVNVSNPILATITNISNTDSPQFTQSEKNIKKDNSKPKQSPGIVKKFQSSQLRKSPDIKKKETIHQQSQKSTNLPTKIIPQKKQLNQYDQDLIKAYKIVYQKCRNEQLKKMTKKMLDSLSISLNKTQNNIKNKQNEVTTIQLKQVLPKQNQKLQKQRSISKDNSTQKYKRKYNYNDPLISDKSKQKYARRYYVQQKKETKEYYPYPQKYISTNKSNNSINNQIQQSPYERIRQISHFNVNSTNNNQKQRTKSGTRKYKYLIDQI